MELSAVEVGSNGCVISRSSRKGRRLWEENERKEIEKVWRRSSEGACVRVVSRKRLRELNKPVKERKE